MAGQRFVFGGGGVEGLALDRRSTPNECSVVFFLRGILEKATFEIDSGSSHEEILPSQHYTAARLRCQRYQLMSTCDAPSKQMV